MQIFEKATFNACEDKAQFFLKKKKATLNSIEIQKSYIYYN